MDSPAIILSLVGVINAIALFVFGFVLNSMKGGIDELKVEYRQLINRVGRLEQERADSLQYRQRVEIMFEALGLRLERIEHKMDKHDNEKTEFWQRYGGGALGNKDTK